MAHFPEETNYSSNTVKTKQIVNDTLSGKIEIKLFCFVGGYCNCVTKIILITIIKMNKLVERTDPESLLPDWLSKVERGRDGKVGGRECVLLAGVSIVQMRMLRMTVTTAYGLLGMLLYFCTCICSHPVSCLEPFIHLTNVK